MSLNWDALVTLQESLSQCQTKTTPYKEVLGHVLTHHNWCGNLMQLYEITSVVSQTGMLGWAASVHCQTERFHSTHSSH